MSVKVVTGRAGSGKSRYLMNHIKTLIADPFAKVIVIVPGALTFETEKSIMQNCGVEGILGLEVLSVQRLCFRILACAGRFSFITHAEKAMICRRALDSLDSPFGGASKLPGFDVSVAELITRLKSHCQTPKSLRQAADRTGDAALRKKLLDMADVYEAFLTLSAGRNDSADMYALAAENADKADFLKGTHIVIDGLDSASPAVMALLEKLMALSGDTVAAFRASEGGRDQEIFAAEEKDMKRFIAAAERAGQTVEIVRTGLEGRHMADALGYLEANLYSYPYRPYEHEPDGISVVEAQTLEQEVKALAAGILAEVKGGRRFRDIAVAGSGLGAYLPYIKSVFARCGIPVFIDERRALSDNAFFDFVHKALLAAAGDMNAVAGYIYSIFSPLDEDERTALYGYAQRYAYRGWHYMNPFWRGDDAAAMETVRQKVMKPIKRLLDAVKRGDAQASAEAVKAFLEGCKEKLEAFCASIDDAETRAEHAYFRQVYEKMREVLDGIARVYGGAPLDAQTLCAMFKTGCDAVRIAVIPPASDEVAVFDVSLSRLPGIDALFAVGVHDGTWPARGDGSGILSAAEREALMEIGLDTGVYDASIEKLKVYTALSKPMERLVLSYNTQTGQPSVLIDRLKRLFPKLKVQKAGGNVMSLKGMEADVLGAVSDALLGKEPDETLLRVCARYLGQSGWREEAEAILLRANAAVPLQTDLAKALYGGIRCSATRIESYYKCPFRHFLDHGIKARTPRDYVHDRIDIGTYMHLALDLFARALIEDKADIRTLGEEETALRMRRAAEEAMRTHDGGKLLEDERFAMQASVLARELVDTALRLRAHFAGSDATLYASEQPFSFDVETAFGSVRITGKIDRIDTAGGYFRVVDYKSSEVKFSLADFAMGLSLQLPVYIEAARRLLEGSGLKPAGGYYMRIGEKYSGSEEEAVNEARMSGLSLRDADVLKAFSAVQPSGGFVAVDQALTTSGELNARGAGRLFDGEELEALLDMSIKRIRDAAEKIYGGDTAICPADADVCKYCGYQSVCRVNAEYEDNAMRPKTAFDRSSLKREGEQ